MSDKFKLLNDVDIKKDSGIIDYKCTTTSQISEIIDTIDSIGDYKIALLWVSSDLINAICNCDRYDMSYMIPELSKHDFIGHITGIAAFYNDSLESNSYRVFIKRDYIGKYEDTRQQ